MTIKWCPKISAKVISKNQMQLQLTQCARHIRVEIRKSNHFPYGVSPSFQACASYDRKHWFRVPTKFDEEKGDLVIEHEPEKVTFWGLVASGCVSVCAEIAACNFVIDG